ncbi:MAG TPA: efflux RND transporter periplasmic adaptor subunit [Planctomycetota bacterium]
MRRSFATPAALLAALLAGGCGASAPPGAKVETKRTKVERGDIVLNVSATGDIKPVKEVELKSKASGQVVRFQKLPGEPVEAGELIAELDKKVEQRNLSLQESNLLSAEANLARTRLQVEADLKRTESEFAAAREEEAQKKSELSRAEKTSDLVTVSELSGYRLAARLAEERTKQTEAALGLIKGRREGDIKLAEAEVLKARVSVDDARERLRDTELLSPIKGILLKKLVEEGQIVASGISATAGGTAIAIVADVSKLYVEANIDETDIAKVRKGQKAEVSLLSGGSEKFKGRVDLILPKGEIDSNVIVFKVRVGIEGEVFGKAYPGMTASVNVRVAEKKDALLIASEAVKMEKGKTVVYVPDGDKSKPLPVKIGLDNGVKAEILEGLDADAEVFVTHTSIPDPKDAKGGRGGRLRF